MLFPMTKESMLVDPLDFDNSISSLISEPEKSASCMLTDEYEEEEKLRRRLSNSFTLTDVEMDLTTSHPRSDYKGDVEEPMFKRRRTETVGAWNLK